MGQKRAGYAFWVRDDARRRVAGIALRALRIHSEATTPRLRPRKTVASAE
jgi:hypothetical protein